MQVRDKSHLIGAKFNLWTVISLVGAQEVIAKCDCGTERKVSVYDITRGASKNCGCIRRLHMHHLGKATTTHGLSHLKILRIWDRMLSRCNNPKDKSYHNYGGRGIKVCDRWNLVENFYADMGEKPEGRYSIDRIDNDGDYCPENCHWATDREQATNTRKNHMVEYHGKTWVLSELARQLGMPPKRVLTLLKDNHRDIFNPFESPQGKLIIYNGKTWSLNALATHLHIDSDTVKNRMREGISVETPIETFRNSKGQFEVVGGLR